MAERLIAPVLKTGVTQVIGGSNPPPTASFLGELFGSIAGMARKPPMTRVRSRARLNTVPGGCCYDLRLLFRTLRPDGRDGAATAARP